MMDPSVLSFRGLASSFDLTVNPSSYLFMQPKACSEAALSLLNCMEESKCVKEDKNSVYDCLKKQNDDPAMSDVCKAQRNAYYMCKHSQLNMRTRIRGTRAY